MLKIENGRIVSDCGKKFRKIGKESVFGDRILLKDETLDMFEELDEIPPFTESQYKEKVVELIRRKYPDNDEFKTQRLAINALLPGGKDTSKEALEAYAAYNDYVEQCRAEARAILSAQRFDNV